MSIKEYIKKNCPYVLIPLLKTSWHILNEPSRRMKLHRIFSHALKYLPYYQDEMSRKILQCRIAFMKNGDRNIFLDLAEKEGWELHSLYGTNGIEYSGITVIYTKDGKDLKYVRKLLKKLYGSGNNFKYLTLKEFMNGVEIPETDLILCAMSWNDASLVVDYASTVKMQNTVLREPYSTREEAHYLDVFHPLQNETVIDAGAYDGATALRFLKWGGNSIRHIYCFEFDPFNVTKCCENLKSYRDKITVVPKGTWDKEQIVSLSATGEESTSVRSNGDTKIQLTSIDAELGSEPVTFIKMDVEGAELKSLIGARNTIIKNHPRLAISVYHKCEDIYEIPACILSIVPEYKFYLRHYNTNSFETVLYAYCE